MLRMLAITLGVTASWAAPITLTMDEAPLQRIHGLSVTKGGLTFTFTEPAFSLFYHSGGPGAVTYVQDPSIQGAAVPFGVGFSSPVRRITFGLAELAHVALFGASVELFNGAQSLGVILFDLTLVDPFPEGQFSWAGDAVTSIWIRPAPGGTALAFDNLTVDTVPEPSVISLAILGLVGIGLARLRR